MALPRLVTLADAARQLGIARQTLRAAVKRGELHPITLNHGRWLRFDESEIEDWVASQRNDYPSPPRAA